MFPRPSHRAKEILRNLEDSELTPEGAVRQPNRRQRDREKLQTLAPAPQMDLFGAATGCPAHVVHCRSAAATKLRAAYRQQGFDADDEACIHYLVLSEEDDVARLRGFAKINPPIRARAEREAIWRHFARAM